MISDSHRFYAQHFNRRTVFVNVSISTCLILLEPNGTCTTVKVQLMARVPARSLVNTHLSQLVIKSLILKVNVVAGTSFLTVQKDFALGQRVYPGICFSGGVPLAIISGGCSLLTFSPSVPSLVN